MNIKDNLELINTVISKRRVGIIQRMNILQIAKVSKNSDDFFENINWELDLNN